MNPEIHSKVQPRHLEKNAYLYVRQSSLRQVFENSESTKRQYDLRQRAVALRPPQLLNCLRTMAETSTPEGSVPKVSPAPSPKCRAQNASATAGGA
jgi:hypothetical protein